MPSNGKRRHPSRRLRSCFDRLEPRIALSGYYVSSAGDDSAAGTVDAPWRTVQRTVASVAPGDVINLRAGTYAGGVVVEKPDITIQSFPGERATMVAPTYDPSGGNNLWFNATGGKALNLDLRGGYYYGVKFEKGDGLVDGCKITDTGYFGIKIVPGADRITIARTEVGNTGLVHGGGGIDDVNADRLTISDCYLHDIRGDAIMVKGGASGAVIERNRIENTTGTGIDAGQVTGAEFFDPIQNPELYEILEPVVRNNIVIGTDYAGIAIYGALRPQVNNNTLINTARVGQASIYLASMERFATNRDAMIVNNIASRTFAGERPLVFVTRDGYSGTMTMDHNRYYNGGSDAGFWDERGGRAFFGNFASWRLTFGLDADSTLGDPGLNASGHIIAGSPVVDAGRNLGGVVDDFDRELRTGTYDIGADESPAVSRGVPSSPANLVAQATSPGAVALSWAPADGADSYLLERAAAADPGWAQVGTAPAGVTTWLDAGLAPATAYRYRARAANAAGTSPYSDTALATTPAVAAPPAGGTLFADRLDGTPAAGWRTVGGDWAPSGGALRQAGLGAADPKKASVAGVAFPTDVEVRARVKVDHWAGGDYARAGVSLGDDAAGRGYNLVFHRDTHTVQFLHDHVAWGNRYDFAWQVGVWYHFALRQQGGVLYGKVWADGQAEPERLDVPPGRLGLPRRAPGLNGGSHAGSTASFNDFSVGVAAPPAGGTLFADRLDGTPAAGWRTVGGDWAPSGGALRQAGLGAADPKKASVAGVAFPTDVEVRARVKVDPGPAATTPAPASASATTPPDAATTSSSTATPTPCSSSTTTSPGATATTSPGRSASGTTSPCGSRGASSTARSGPTARPSPAGWMFRQDGWASRAGRRGSTAAPTPAPPPASTTSR